MSGSDAKQSFVYLGCVAHFQAQVSTKRSPGCQGARVSSSSSARLGSLGRADSEAVRHGTNHVFLQLFGVFADSIHHGEWEALPAQASALTCELGGQFPSAKHFPHILQICKDLRRKLDRQEAPHDFEVLEHPAQARIFKQRK